MPFAAFFVAFLLLLCILRRSRKLAVCLLLGALAGLCAVYTTNARLERTREDYAGRTVLLTAEVERADSTYFSDTVDATLWVESVNNSPAGFRMACAELPACAAGQRVQGLVHAATTGHGRTDGAVRGRHRLAGRALGRKAAAHRVG